MVRHVCLLRGCEWSTQHSDDMEIGDAPLPTTSRDPTLDRSRVYRDSTDVSAIWSATVCCFDEWQEQNRHHIFCYSTIKMFANFTTRRKYEVPIDERIWDPGRQHLRKVLRHCISRMHYSNHLFVGKLSAFGSNNVDITLADSLNVPNFVAMSSLEYFEYDEGE